MTSNRNGHTKVFPNFPQAVCRKSDPDTGEPYAMLFDPRRRGESRGTRGPTIARHELAKRICFVCPHRDECRDWGVYEHYDHPADAGPVIGGLTDTERIEVRRRHSIPTPIRIGWEFIRTCGHENTEQSLTPGRCPECRAKYVLEDAKERWYREHHEQKEAS